MSLYNFSDELRNWVDDNFKSLRDFQRKSGIPYSTMQNYLRGERMPSYEMMTKLETLGFRDPSISTNKFKVSSTIPQKEDLAPDQFNQIFKIVHQIDVAASAGTGNVIFEQEMTETLAFNKQWLEGRGLQNSTLSVISVQGDSMENEMHDGDLVLISHEQKLINKKIYVVRDESGHLFIKRLRLVKSTWIASSDNPRYDPFELTDRCELIGRAECLMKSL